MTVLVFCNCIALLSINANVSASTDRVGLGSTVSAWRTAYGLDKSCPDKNSCFGPASTSSSGRFQFIDVEWGPRAVSYQENFPDRTTATLALAQVKLTLPTDSRYGTPHVNRDSYGDTCLIVNGTSVELGGLVRSHHFGIELLNYDSNGTFYQASSVSSAYVDDSSFPPSAGC